MTNDDEAQAPGELSEITFGRALAAGALIGLPLVFATALVMSLGAGWPNAAGVAIVPSLFGAPFFGGVVLLMKGLAAAEAEQQVLRAERRAEREQRAAAPVAA